MITTAELRETRFDPVFAVHGLLRRVLDATARPGLVVDLGELALTVPPPRLRPACALLLSLMDHEVSFHVLGPDAERIRTYLRFNTEARATMLSDADFVLVPSSGLPWPDAPREGATVVCVPDSLSNSPAVADVVLHLQGPGIPGERTLFVQGLRRDDLGPLLDDDGVPIELWLAAGAGSLAVITRSTRCR
jgi:alpha-D-ribose 1-methylphosphonate 5-triphosphate synthase subunit PhnH